MEEYAYFSYKIWFLSQKLRKTFSGFQFFKKYITSHPPPHTPKQPMSRVNRNFPNLKKNGILIRFRPKISENLKLIMYMENLRTTKFQCW